MRILFTARIDFKNAFHSVTHCWIATCMEIYNIISVVKQCSTATMKTFNQLFFMDDLIMRTCAKEEIQQKWAIICMACLLQLRNLGGEIHFRNTREKREINRLTEKEENKKKQN